MTDEETHRTGELLSSLAGKHSIVVIEHDMTFVRQIAAGRKVTVLHQGTVLCEGKVDEVQNDESVIEVYLGRQTQLTTEPLLTVQRRLEAFDIGGCRILRGVNIEVPAGEVVCLMGRNGVGKTTTLRSIIGLLAERRHDQIRRPDITRLSPEARAAAASVTCRRAANFSAPHGRRKSPRRRASPRSESSMAARTRLHALPDPEGNAVAQRRHAPAGSSNNSRSAARC